MGKAIVYHATKNIAYAIVTETYDNAYIQVGNFVAATDRDLEDIPEYEP